jgi:hypothetical protein
VAPRGSARGGRRARWIARARIAFVAVALALGACKGGKKTIQRAKDGGAPVAVVDKPVTNGGGEVRYTPETEPDDDRDHASALPLGGGAQGTIAGDADVDVYKLTMTAPGMVSIQTDALDGVDLILELQNGAGEVVARSDRGPAKTSEGVPNLALQKGDWYVVVRPFVKPKPKPRHKGKGKGDAPAAIDAGAEVVESPAYHVTAQAVAPADLTEREPDDDAGAASEVFLGDTVKGWIGWTGDVDVWKLSLEGLGQRNALDLDVAAVPGVALTVEVLDGTGKSLLVRKGVRNGPVSVKSLLAAVADGQPPYHYVKVSGDKSNPVDAYTLHVAGRLLDLDEEAEPNDTIDHATPLRVNATADSGTMRAAHAAGDVDWFGLDAAPVDQLLDVSVEAPAGTDIVVEAHAQDGRLLGSADAGKVGEREHLSGVTIPANTAVRIKVEAKPDKKDTGEPRDYSLRWSISPAEGAPMPPEEKDEPSGSSTP